MSDDKCAEQLLEITPQLMQLIRCEMRETIKGALTVPQFRVLARISKGSANLGELSEFIGVSLPSVSRMVEVLHKRQLVLRIHSELDRRHVQLSLSSKGQKFFAATKSAAQRSLARKISFLPVIEKDVVLKALGILRETFLHQEAFHEDHSSGSSRTFRPDGLRARTDK